MSSARLINEPKQNLLNELNSSQFIRVDFELFLNRLDLRFIYSPIHYKILIMIIWFVGIIIWFVLTIQSICWQYVKQVFTSCDDLLRKKQFCYILARHVSLEFYNFDTF